MLSLYVHVPFCESLCHYCACNKLITRDAELPRRYLAVIEREIASVREALGEPRPVTQHHWGGGTPTYLEPAQIERLVRALDSAFPRAPGAEVSLEVDPRVTSREQLVAEVAKARASGKPTIVDVWATWCTYCRKYDDVIEASPELRREIGRLHRLRMDLSSEDRPWEEGLRAGLGIPRDQQPFMVFIDEQGRIRRDLDVDRWLKEES